MICFYLIFFGLKAVLSGNVGEISVPQDHNLPESKTIRIAIEYLNDFDPGKETVLMIEDAFDQEFRGLNIENGLTATFNFVLIKGRKSSRTFRNGSKGMGRSTIQRLILY